MTDLRTIKVRDVKFSEENNRIQWRCAQWREDLTLADLDSLGVAGLYRFPGLGKKSVNAIIAAIAEVRNA